MAKKATKKRSRRVKKEDFCAQEAARGCLADVFRAIKAEAVHGEGIAKIQACKMLVEMADLSPIDGQANQVYEVRLNEIKVTEEGKIVKLRAG